MHSISRRDLLRAGIVIAGTAGFARITPGLAAEETTLTLYNGQHTYTTEPLCKAFTEATGIKVDIRKGKSSQLANQIIEEGAASPADLFYSEESPPIVALAEKEMLSKVDPETLKQIPAKHVAKNGTWISTSARCRIVAYNKAMVKESDLPKTVLDFGTEAWKDKVAFVPTSGAFQEQIVAIKILKGRDAALGWLKGLKANGRTYNSNGAALKAVEKGEIATGLINNYYWYALAKEIGEANMKSAIYNMGGKDPGSLISVSAAGILKSSKKQDAAQKLLAFMVSAEGQQVIVDSVAEYPVRAGIKSPYNLIPMEELDPPELTPADMGNGADAIQLLREAGLA